MLAASITLLPALLTFFGRKVGERGRLARLFSRRRKTDRAPRPGFWVRWIGVIQRHPAIAAIAATAFMLALAAPALWLRLGSSDAGNNPTSLTSRRAYDLLAQGFGPGFNGPLTIVAKLPAGASPSSLDELHKALAATPDVVDGRPAAAESGRRRRDRHRLPALLTAELRRPGSSSSASATTSCRRSSRRRKRRSTSAA